MGIHSFKDLLEPKVDIGEESLWLSDGSYLRKPSFTTDDNNKN